MIKPFIKIIILFLTICIMILPFKIFVSLNDKANMAKEIRNRQFLMPLLALAYLTTALLFLSDINRLLLLLIESFPVWMDNFRYWLHYVAGGYLDFLGNLARLLGKCVRFVTSNINMTFWISFISNSLIMLVYIIFKKDIVRYSRMKFQTTDDFTSKSINEEFSKKLSESVMGLFYTKEKNREESWQIKPAFRQGQLISQNEIWYVKPVFGQSQAFLRNLYYASVTLCLCSMMAAIVLYYRRLISGSFMPVFGMILIGEVYFFLGGKTKQEAEDELKGGEDKTKRICNYALLRKILRKLFGDKLQAEDTNVTGTSVAIQTNDELLNELQRSDMAMVEAYGCFMRAQLAAGREPDRNYIISGLELLKGKSILFNNPFYYDLIPYVFYPMNRTLLRHKKVLVVLGRHGTEKDIIQWCDKGFRTVTNVEGMWHVDLLSEKSADLDVGIIDRSSVHDLKLHEANDEFFAQVEFVMLIEPSRLVTTAQIGLNLLIRHCMSEKKHITFCSTDKNCDGLVDSLSHILMTNITEVAPTNRYKGVCSYMCWETDSEYLHHRMLPDISRYLGTGTELSFVALKNQVPETLWFGGDAFPVIDMHWIVKQYYYDLLHYAQLPISQKSIDDFFKVSYNLCDARIQGNQYMTVEDEAFNMFEIKRDFSTRAKGQSFINIISSEYLLKDYMAQNNTIFNVDPKAIPYIVADYARTLRNVVMRLCLLMSSGAVPKEDVRQELMLIEADAEPLKEHLWDLVCGVNQSIGVSLQNEDGEKVLKRTVSGIERTFGPETICVRRKFSIKTGKMQDLFYIDDTNFKTALLCDLQNAVYIAEDEDGERHYLGTELCGHIFQKYLPGQFFTFNGKYYEMLSVTADRQVLIRRAADHITGRPSYRQVRNYVITNAVDSNAMGDVKDIGGIRVIRQYADLRVETPAYWKMNRYNDFSDASKVTINAIPDRTYYNKQILKIDLPKTADIDVVRTIVMLLNELFRTVFADNQPYIAALTTGEADEPVTFSLRGEKSFTPQEGSIYIIEDSQLDIGLLVAFERNLMRMLYIICDYLDWHLNQVEISKKSPKPPKASESSESSEPPEPGVIKESEPKKRFQPQIKKNKIKNFFEKVGHTVSNFFKKLFGKKNKPNEAEEPEKPETGKPGQPQNTEPEKPETGKPDSSENEKAKEPDDKGTSGTPDDDGKDTVIFEREKKLKHESGKGERKPYHERFYLLYGGEDIPEQFDIITTYNFLRGCGFAGGSLKQARDAKNILEMIEKTYDPSKKDAHFCDFCGVELVGSDFDILSDGRERCPNCRRTSVKTEAEFKQIYYTVKQNMEALFGIRFKAPIEVRVVNTAKLNKELGKPFVPTSKFDIRAIGFARNNRKKHFVYVENGSPRISTIKTIAHELTHIWQFQNWDYKEICRKYGSGMKYKEVCEGMAMWVEIQYIYLIGEPAVAKREEICTRMREDEYGKGFRRYVAKYPLSFGTCLEHPTPFEHPDSPL